MIFPVLLPPMVRVFILRPCIVPFPDRERPCVVPDDGVAAIDATGVDNPATPVKLNLEEVVAVPPRRKSRTDESFGLIVPLVVDTSQLDPLPPPQLARVKRQRLSVVPVSGIVKVTSFPVAEVKVVKKEVLPVNWRLPLLLTVNLVAPDADAVNKSPELSLNQSQRVFL